MQPEGLRRGHQREGADEVDVLVDRLELGRVVGPRFRELVPLVENLSGISVEGSDFSSERFCVINTPRQ